VEPGQPIPATLRVVGTVDGEAVQQEVPVPSDMVEATYLPRAWSKLEIDRLLAEDSAKHKDQIVSLSKQMYVMSPFTSLLVLENDEMYQRFKVDRGRKDHWAAYATPQKIEVKYEPEVGQPVDARFAPKTEKPHANTILQTIIVRTPASILTWPNRERQGRQVTTALQVYRGAFAMPAKGDDLDDAHPSADAEPERLNASMDRLERTIFTGAAPMEKLLKDQAKSLQMLNGSLRELRSSPFQLRNVSGMRQEDRRKAAADEFFLERGESLALAAAPRAHNPMAPPQADSFRRFADYGGEAGKANQFTSFDGKWGYLADKAGLAPFSKSQDAVFKRLAEADKLMEAIGQGASNAPRLYGRPSFSNDEAVFSDLLAYAPGLSTSNADIEAVLEAEAQPGLASLPGTIDPAAKVLIDRARAAGWQTLTLPAQDGKAAVQVVFDGQGRYAYQRTTPMGLREEVVCDGQTILHLYPELGLGARRQVTRFHRLQFAELVQGLVLPAEDLARGADVKKTGANTIVLVPRGAEGKKDDDGKPVSYGYAQLTFGTTGKLAERRLVAVTFDEKGAKKEEVFRRETYTPAGLVQQFDGKDQELAKREMKLSAAKEPSLTRDVSSLVVLPLPWRTSQQIYSKLNINPNLLQNGWENWTLEYLDGDTALALLAAEFVQNNGPRARQIVQRCFLTNGVNKLGFYTLLAALNQPFAADASFRQLLEQQPASPLARYLALQGNPLYRKLQERYGLNLGDGVGPDTDLLQRLAAFRDLYLQQNFRPGQDSLAERQRRLERGLAYVNRNKDSVLGWAMLSLLQDRAHEPTGTLQARVADAWKLFIDASELGYVARYEQARSLLNSGKQAEAAKLFLEMYEQLVKQQVLPPIDGSFRAALLGDGKTPEQWTPLMERTAQVLLKDNHRLTLVKLAWQCRQLGDFPQAENLLAAALQNPKDDAERLLVTTAAVDYLLETSQDVRADSLVTPLLENADFAQRPGLWRLASLVAQRRNQPVRSIGYLEKALDLEFQALPEVVNLRQVRRDYGRLLEHYAWLADAVQTLKIEAPADLPTRTIRAADRWRSMDRDSNDVCERAARILKTLGARDLAWEYLTTPVGMKPNEAGPWLNLARSLGHQGELELANRAYQAAFDAEPTDAQVLWDQAQNLDRAGQKAAADLLRRRIVDGSWQPRFAGLKAQAKWQLEGR